jgi:hypothetical protein
MSGIRQKVTDYALAHLGTQYDSKARYRPRALSVALLNNDGVVSPAHAGERQRICPTLIASYGAQFRCAAVFCHRKTHDCRGLRLIACRHGTRRG